MLTTIRAGAEGAFNLSGADAVQWDHPGLRDQQFSIAADSVAKVLAAIDAHVLALTEVGDETDVAELVAKLDALGVSYPRSAVCACTDHTTAQGVAVLSKLSLSNVVAIIPGRETGTSTQSCAGQGPVCPVRLSIGYWGILIVGAVLTVYLIFS